MGRQSFKKEAEVLPFKVLSLRYTILVGKSCSSNENGYEIILKRRLVAFMHEMVAGLTCTYQKKVSLKSSHS